MDEVCFLLSKVDRKDELITLLLYSRDVGGLVLFDSSKLDLFATGEDFVVFCP